MTILDVFLLDSDFKIVHPIGYYRKGLHLLRPESADREFRTFERMHEVAPQQTDVDRTPTTDSIISRLTKALKHSTPNMDNVENQENKSPRLRHVRHDSVSSGSSVASYLSPSPEQNQQQSQTSTENKRQKRQKRSQDISEHVFYVENSQMRLKLFAGNEVSS